MMLMFRVYKNVVQVSGILKYINTVLLGYSLKTVYVIDGSTQQSATHVDMQQIRVLLLL